MTYHSLRIVAGRRTLIVNFAWATNRHPDWPVKDEKGEKASPTPSETSSALLASQCWGLSWHSFEEKLLNSPLGGTSYIQCCPFTTFT